MTETDGLRQRHLPLDAVFSTLEGADVVRHYGDSAAEYRAIHDTVGVVERSDVKVGRMWGRDPVRMLNGLITNDLGLLAADRAVYGALLTPKGRIISDLRTWSVDEDRGLMFEFPAAAESELTAHLRKYVPPMFAKWEVVDGSRVFGIYGPEASALVASLLDTEAEWAEDRIVASSDREILVVGSAVIGRGRGWEVLASGDQPGAVWSRLVELAREFGGAPVGFAALEIARIEAGRPRIGLDVTDSTLPAEAYESTGQMERAISFSKGCYTGQEVVVRIAHRGHVNRHLRGLRMGDRTAPKGGTELFREGNEKAMGWVSSAAQSPRSGEVLGLGYVRREIAIGDTLRLGSPEGDPVTVTDLPIT